ncbi:Helix-loop-helix DNA-binding protein [Niveomyces insectorum RCEF 264]|uniref:Helix-loop-helix DNA-binding protein n=1 Tax=Niveomyces insectorum RCEF 264 TaxID=1081102 RepID=A0A167Y4A8_9HYPO|nr:Helix-loop-helix DNA-binding protein [Niveomyces insectorum RCEF 264]
MQQQQQQPQQHQHQQLHQQQQQQQGETASGKQSNGRPPARTATTSHVQSMTTTAYKTDNAGYNNRQRKRVRHFTPDDRAAHRVFERLRREAFRENLVELASFLPSLADTDPNRLSKHMVVHASIVQHQEQRRRIEQLTCERDELLAEINRWRVQAGFEPAVAQDAPAVASGGGGNDDGDGHGNDAVDVLEEVPGEVAAMEAAAPAAMPDGRLDLVGEAAAAPPPPPALPPPPPSRPPPTLHQPYPPLLLDNGTTALPMGEDMLGSDSDLGLSPGYDLTAAPPPVPLATHLEKPQTEHVEVLPMHTMTVPDDPSAWPWGSPTLDVPSDNHVLPWTDDLLLDNSTMGRLVTSAIAPPTVAPVGPITSMAPIPSSVRPIPAATENEYRGPPDALLVAGAEPLQHQDFARGPSPLLEHMFWRLTP